jgi:hypothetical protein
MLSEPEFAWAAHLRRGASPPPAPHAHVYSMEEAREETTMTRTAKTPTHNVDALAPAAHLYGGV